MRARGRLASLLFVLWVVPACVTDHDALAQSPGRGGNTSRGGTAGTAGDFPQLPTSGSSSGGTGGREPEERPGQNVLTIVNGIVDAPEVLLCLARGGDPEAGAVGAPLDAEGLAYGASLTLPVLEGVDLATDDLVPFVIAGELSLVHDEDCATALAIAREEQALGLPRPELEPGVGGAPGMGGAGAGGLQVAPAGSGALDEAQAGAGGAGELPDPPRLRVAALPLIPAGTLSAARGRSMLYVTNGCIGGPAFMDANATAACGDTYGLRAPTLGAVLVPLSRRVTYDKVGLQVVHAARAAGRVDVQSAETDGLEGARYLATGVEFGAIVPRSARADYTSAELGANLGFHEVQVVVGGSVRFVERWGSLLRTSGLASVDDGRNYTLVLLGPSFELVAESPWNAPTIALIANDAGVVEE